MNYHLKSAEDLTDWVYNAPLGSPCPLCAGHDPYNGTGPDHMPWARFLLKLIWWDEAIQAAVKVHDRRCHVGNHPFNLSFEDTNKEFRVNVKKAMKQFINKYWYRRYLLKYLYIWVDEIYYWAVSGKNGKKAYDKNSCLVVGGN